MPNFYRGMACVILVSGAASGLTAHPAAAAVQVLHTFIGYDGSQPVAELSNVNGTLYGVTSQGGGLQGGTVFSVTPAGLPKILYTFGAPGDGANPAARLIEVGGLLYGTTQNGGTAPCACGTVFSVTLTGHVTILHSFSGGTDGANPVSRLTELNGTLYGTTASGGAYGGGTMFSLNGGVETVLYSFGATSTDSRNPLAGLENVGGVLYGTASYGGTGTNCYRGCGTVFSITPAGAESVLYSFQGYRWGGGRSTDGAVPAAGVIDVGGTLYGTTSEGGFYNFGTVFSVTTAGTELVLHSFTGSKHSKSDGQQPLGALTEFNGDLYGTTKLGGEGFNSAGCPDGCGSVFAIRPASKENPVDKEIKLLPFNVSDGAEPASGLLAVGSVLYGTTTGGGLSGGSGGTGTVFSITP